MSSPYQKMSSPEKSEKALMSLDKETKKWLREGIISQEQANSIIARYQISAPERKSQKKSRLVKILAIFGSLLVGIGVILFIAANWRNIPDFVYALLLIASTAFTYYLGWYLKYKKANHPSIGDALIVLGSLLFGASLILIGQIYHIRMEFSNYLLIWSLAILPLAYFEKSLPIFIISNILVMVWAGFSLDGNNLSDGDFSWQYYVSLLFIVGVLLPLAYKLKSRILLALASIESLAWLVPFVVFKWLGHTDAPIPNTILFLLSCGVILFLLGVFHSKLTEQFKNFKGVFYPIGAIMAMFSSFLLTFPQIYETARHGSGEFMSVLFNFVLLAEIIAIIALGLKDEEDGFVNMGILFFGLLVAARYFSLTWGLGSRSVVFIVGGILLIIGSYFLDRLRKKLLLSINEKQGINTEKL